VTRVFEGFARALLGMKVPEINAQPKVFSRSLLERIKNPPSTFAFDVYLLFQAVKAGYSIQTIPVYFPPRVHGFSNWSASFFKRYKTILGMIAYMRSLGSKEGRA